MWSVCLCRACLWPLQIVSSLERPPCSGPSFRRRRVTSLLSRRKGCLCSYLYTGASLPCISSISCIGRESVPLSLSRVHMHTGLSVLQRFGEDIHSVLPSAVARSSCLQTPPYYQDARYGHVSVPPRDEHREHLAEQNRIQHLPPPTSRRLGRKDTP